MHAQRWSRFQPKGIHGAPQWIGVSCLHPSHLNLCYRLRCRTEWFPREVAADHMPSTGSARPLRPVMNTDLSPSAHSPHAQHSEHLKSWELQTSRHLHRKGICWGETGSCPLYTPWCRKHLHIRLSGASLGLLTLLCHCLSAVVGGLKTGNSHSHVAYS